MPDRAATAIRVDDLASASNAQAAEWLVDLAGNLSERERAVLVGETDPTAEVALVAIVMLASDAWVVVADGGDAVAVFGCCPTPGGESVWGFATDATRRSLDLPRLAAPYLAQLRDRSRHV